MPDYAHNDEEHPRNSPHHDLLVINPDGVLHRFEVEKRQNHPNEGRYVSAPEAAHYREPGHRKVFNIAHAQPFSEASAGAGRITSASPATDQEGLQDRGPAFAMLPVKPEPASSNWACYLINAQRLAYKNPWTTVAWNDEPEAMGQGDAATRTGKTPEGGFELLVAGPVGDVYYVNPSNEPAAITPVPLAQEQDIWSQLRNGCVVGTAQYYNHPSGTPKVIPLVNAACLAAPKGRR